MNWPPRAERLLRNVEHVWRAASPSFGRLGRRRFGLYDFESDQRPQPLFEPGPGLAQAQQGQGPRRLLAGAIRLGSTGCTGSPDCGAMNSCRYSGPAGTPASRTAMLIAAAGRVCGIARRLPPVGVEQSLRPGCACVSRSVGVQRPVASGRNLLGRSKLDRLPMAQRSRSLRARTQNRSHSRCSHAEWPLTETSRSVPSISPWHWAQVRSSGMSSGSVPALAMTCR